MVGKFGFVREDGGHQFPSETAQISFDAYCSGMELGLAIAAAIFTSGLDSSATKAAVNNALRLAENFLERLIAKKVGHAIA